MSLGAYKQNRAERSTVLSAFGLQLLLNCRGTSLSVSDTAVAGKLALLGLRVSHLPSSLLLNLCPLAHARDC